MLIASELLGIVVTDDMLELLLCGNGGLLVSTLVVTVAVGCLSCDNSVSDTDTVIDVADGSATLVDETAVAAAAATAIVAMLEDASWLYDLTIMRPLGPIFGVTLLAEGSGGVPVTLAGPGEC